MAPHDHPAMAEVLAYADNRAETADWERVHAHLETGCDRCIRQLALSLRLTSALRTQPAPPRPSEKRGEFLQQAMAAFDELAPAPSLWNQLIARLSAGGRDAPQAMQDALAVFRLLFANNPLPIWIHDAATLQFIELNEAVCEQYGYPRRQMLQMRVADLVAAEADAPEPGPAHQQHRTAEGKVLDVDLSSHTLDLDVGRLVLVVARDVTERMQAEETLRQSQKMEAIGRVAGGVAHDFNNLLGVIVGYSELLALQIPSSEKMHQYAVEIHRAAERGASLTRQLLSFSRRETLRPRVVDLNEAVRDMESMLRRLTGDKVELIMSLEQGLGDVKLNSGHSDQLLMNLVVNARDAMPDGGRITIATANVHLEDTHSLRSPHAAPGPYVMLSVSDTGCGMDAGTQARLFEPFFTTKEPGRGTGLGLATVYAIVNKSGGGIRVSSKVGQGTLFEIYLPRLAPVRSASEPEGEPSAVIEGLRQGPSAVPVEAMHASRRLAAARRNAARLRRAAASPQASRARGEQIEAPKCGCGEPGAARPPSMEIERVLGERPSVPHHTRQESGHAGCTEGPGGAACAGI